MEVVLYKRKTQWLEVIENIGHYDALPKLKLLSEHDGYPVLPISNIHVDQLVDILDLLPFHRIAHKTDFFSGPDKNYLG